MAQENQIKTIYIQARQPVAERVCGKLSWSFPGRVFEPGTTVDLDETRVVVGGHRQEYNQVRPHSRLGYESPAVFAARSCVPPAPVGLRPPSAGDGQQTDKNINSTMSQD